MERTIPERVPVVGSQRSLGPDVQDVDIWAVGCIMGRDLRFPGCVSAVFMLKPGSR